jgi:hypothetical protein
MGKPMDEAVVGIVSQFGVREHAKGGCVGKLDRAIRGCLIQIKRLKRNSFISGERRRRGDKPCTPKP